MSEWKKSSNEQLNTLLDGFYECTRVWEAWQIGTMRDADFQPAAESDLVADLIAWRDAAVSAAASSGEGSRDDR